MSHRIKRPNRSDDGSVPTKRRKRPTAEEEEAASLAPWHTRALNDFKIYNRTTTEAPAELFRKDLISAMKLPDSEPLAAHEYWVIVDQWKQEWERGVQVPVNPDSLPEPSVTITDCTNNFKPQHEFKLPKTRYIRITKDDRFKSEDHMLSNAPALAEAACSYDLDECDVAWLKLVNEERMCMGMNPITEDQLERVLERLEIRCWDKIQSILRNEEGLGIEYDENVICDVCRSPDSEEGNEMVFCDSCNICVHQACYGITRIPEGQWLCCTCALSQRPDCVLCPNKGGAMKCTRSGKHWAHVSCALWIPEVSIGCVEKMEPITKISSIPQSRWALICVLCRERVGACIQCSVKTCKTAYHVTCAFKHGLEMRAIIEDENADDGVKLRSYCEKHSKSSKKEKSVCSGSEDDDSKRRKRKDMTSEEKNQVRAARLQEIESEFYKHVSIKDIVNIEIDNDALQYIYNYWKLKRKAGNNKPLLPPKSDDADMLSHKQEQADLEKMKMFVQLRQDLERVRNLCYMVSRREKLSRTFFRMREQTFHKQAAVLASGYHNLSTPVVQAVIEANHGPSIYDRLYSHSGAEDHTADFDIVLARIAGLKSPQDERRSDYNGVFKENNPYKKVYFNGSSKRRSGSLYGSSMSSASSSDERPKDKENRIQSSSEEENIDRKKVVSVHRRNTNSKASERRQKRLSMASKVKVDSSSEEDVKKTVKDWRNLSKSRLVQMENELGISGSDSDELMPIRSSKHIELQKTAATLIYSDSDSTDTSIRNDDKSSNTASDSQQNRMRTKAAVKEFSQKPSTSKCPNKSSSENKKRTKEELKRNVINKKRDYVPSDLIVPQRKAAKKASENMKSTTNSRVKEQQQATNFDNETKMPVEEKLKAKPKLRVSKEVKETKETSKRENKNDIFDIDKEMDKLENQEILAYVPQRQAAKKATEHIKSLGKPGVSEVDSDKSKNSEHNRAKKIEIDSKKKEIEDKPAKVSDTKRKSSSNSSTSSTSSSSTDSSSTSTSDSEDEQSKPQSESLFSAQSRELTKRTSAKDWPFLDKDAKSSATSSSSDSSDSSRLSTPTKLTSVAKSKTDSSLQVSSRKPHITKPIRKSSDKKPTPLEREESARIRGKGRRRGRPRTSNSSDRFRDVNVRSGDISDSQRGIVDREELKIRKGKSDDMEEQSEKESDNTTKLLSPVRKTDKKLDDVNFTITNLEKEILERKAGREGNISKTKSTLDKLFRSSDKKEKPHINTAERQKITEKIKSPEKSSSTPDLTSKATVKMHKSMEKPRSPEKSFTENCEKPNKFLEKNINPSEELKKLPEKLLIEKLTKTEKNIKSSEKIIKIHEKINKSPEKSLKSVEKVDCTVERKIQDKSKTDKHYNSPIKESRESIMVDEVMGSLNTFHVKNKNVIANKVITNNINLESDEVSNEKKPSQVDEKINEKCLTEQKANNMEEKRQVRIVQQNRSIFSPQPNEKDTDLFDEFDNILPDDFGIPKEDEILKNPMVISINNVPLFKEDSKEDSARETLNLVEKLRMELSKKSTSYDVDDSVSVASSIKNDNDRAEFTEQIVPNNIIDTSQKEDINMEEQRHINLEIRVDLSEIKQINQEKDFRYISNDINITNDVLSEPHQHVHHSVSGEADERWVPPSENYQNIEQKKYSNSTTTEETQSYLPNFDSQHLTRAVNNVQVGNALPPQIEKSSLTSQMDVPADEETPKNQSPNLQDCRVSQTPYLDPASMDCIPSPSSYADIHPQAKWADRHVMPNRRSSSSSAASTTSSPSRRNDVEDELMKRQEMIIANSIDVSYGVIPSFAPNPLEGFPTYTEQSQCVGPVSLFPPPNINNQLFPSPGAAMFPPPSFGAPFPGLHSMINPGPKPVEEPIHYPSPCTAAFTSSQHNMALTAAMVNPPQLPKDSSQEEETVAVAPPLPPPPVAVQTPTETSATTPSEEIPASPALSNSTPTSNYVQPSPNPSLKSNSSAGKKSPSKPTRTSARFLSQQSKSPSKSPGKSPRQESLSKGCTSNRGRTENRRGVGKSSTGRGGQMQARGRGRGRGRGRSSHVQHNEYDHTIHNKLVGTVYDLDFDDDITNESMSDLRAMRERRKSVDLHDRKSENTIQHISRDSSQSPKFASPSHTSHKSRTFTTDLRELRPPTPITDTQTKLDLHSASLPSCEISQTFQDIVQPLLPGPVDMRTYNSYDSQTYNESNLLGAFSSSGAPEQPVHEEIDEDFEKEFQSALTSYPKIEKASVPEVSNIKVSLSDSRNQLKVKIKGPIANYTSTVAPLPSTATDISATSITTNLVPNTISSNAAINPGTSNLRRMRKKELLRQYWTQNMNMDDPASTVGLSATPTVPLVSRSIITIPKAVASMTSIPTKDDYRDYRTGIDDLIETKHRKENKARPGAMTRELRQLDIPTEDDGLERRRSITSTGSNASFSSNFDANKRRGRPPRPSQTAPKLKIRISSNSIVGGNKVDDKKDAIRPPKKRLPTIARPSVEDLKRESMKFRKQVMADFSEEKRKKKDKGGKKKKKRKQQMQIISNDSVNPTKLIIRFSKKVNNESDNKRTSMGEFASGEKDENVDKQSNIERNGAKINNSADISETDPLISAGATALRMVRTNKVTPIKLKLSRCQEGSGYIMATNPSVPPSEEENCTMASATSTAALNVPESVHPTALLPLNKDCEVR